MLREEELLGFYGLIDDGVVDDSTENPRSKRAVSIIRDRILDLTLSPGARIDVNTMMDQFRLGRTPAREAFNRLAAEGLIILKRNKGTYVRDLDIEHIRQFFDAYISSERVVGYFCQGSTDGLAGKLREIEDEYQEAYAHSQFLRMTQLNARFHGYIAVSSRNEYISEHALRLYNNARRLSYFIYTTNTKFIDELQEMQNKIKSDHEEIIETAAQGDRNRMVDTLTRHAGLFHRRVVRAIAGTAAYKSPLPTQSDASNF